MKATRITLITAAISVAFTVVGCNREKAPADAAAAPPPGIPVAEVVVRPVTPFVEFTGSLTAVKRVELRPRVAGYIQAVSVPEGRFVEKGAQLFLIDPRVFQAALNAATALPPATRWQSCSAKPPRRRALTIARTNQRLAVVSIYKALGGGWQTCTHAGASICTTP